MICHKRRGHFRTTSSRVVTMPTSFKDYLTGTVEQASAGQKAQARKRFLSVSPRPLQCRGRALTDCMDPPGCPRLVAPRRMAGSRRRHGRCGNACARCHKSCTVAWPALAPTVPPGRQPLPNTYRWQSHRHTKTRSFYRSPNKDDTALRRPPSRLAHPPTPLRRRR